MLLSSSGNKLIFENQQDKRINLADQNYITAWCKIENGLVNKDGRDLFTHAGDVGSLLLAAYQHFRLSYPKFHKMDRLSKLGWLATEVLLMDSFEQGKYEPEDISVILANASSSLDDDLKYYDSVAEAASPSLFVYTLPNIVIGEICIRNHFKGEQAFFIQGNFQSELIQQQVAYLLANGYTKCCVCGWVDILGEEYKCVLFLVEKIKKGNAALFSAANMDKIFNSTE